MKLLIDVSHIINWKGRLSGVERVEYHIIKHYHESEDATFICWDNHRMCFTQVDKKTIKKSIVERTSESEMNLDIRPQTRTIIGRVKAKVQSGRSSHSNSDDVPNGKIIILAGLWDNLGYIGGVERLSKDHEIVHVVYDMIPIIEQGFVVDYLPKVFGEYMYRILPLCSRVFAISEATAHDTEKVLKAQNLHVPPISTFRLGDDISRAKSSIRPSGVEDRFILTVGTIEARKNHTLLYYAYKSLINQGKEVPDLVIVGKRGWHTDDFQYIVEHDAQVKNRIKILDKVTDSELRWLYESCLFTVTPSFYEGWGLPIAESLGYGKVTLSSNTSSMPEVGGKNADYFPPYSVDQLGLLINNYLDKNVRMKREEYVRMNYRQTSWEMSVNQLGAALS